MSKENQHIEDFLRDKLSDYHMRYEDDWNVFERKLNRALLLKRLRTTAIAGVVLLLVTLALWNIPGITGPVNRIPLEQQQIVEDNTGLPAISHKEMPAAGKPLLKTSELPTEIKPQGEATIAEHEKIEETSKVVHNAAPGNSKSIGFTAGSSQETKVAVPGESQKMIPKAESTGQSKVETQSLLALAPLEMDKNVAYPVHTDMEIRNPVSKVKINYADIGPYISPLQEKNPWSYTINVYPNFTFRKFKVDQDKLGYIHRDFIDAMQVGERGGLSMNVGLRISRRVGPITYINGGVEYINYKTHAQFDFMKFRDANIDPGSGKIKDYSLIQEPARVTLNDENSYHYVNIPLSISYQPWASSHIRLNIEAGGSLLYFLAARGRSINYKTLEIVDLADRSYRSYMGSFSLKVGANYFVSEKFNFGFEPTLMYFTNTIYSSDYPFQVIPYSVGVNLKLQVKLN